MLRNTIAPQLNPDPNYRFIAPPPGASLPPLVYRTSRLVACEKLLDAFGYIRGLIDHLFRQPLQLIGADGIYVPRPLFRFLQKSGSLAL